MPHIKDETVLNNTKVANQAIFHLTPISGLTWKNEVRYIWSIFFSVSPFWNVSHYPFLQNILRAITILSRNGQSKISGIQPLKNLKWYGLPSWTISLKIFKGCLPELLIGPVMNTLTHTFLKQSHILIDKRWFQIRYWG